MAKACEIVSVIFPEKAKTNFVEMYILDFENYLAAAVKKETDGLFAKQHWQSSRLMFLAASAADLLQKLRTVVVWD